MKRVAIIIVGISLGVGTYFLFAGVNSNYRVVVNRTNPVTALSKKQLSEIFLKKVEKWDHGQEVHPVDLLDDSPIRNQFTLDIHQKDLTKIIAYWKKEFFKNQTVSPPQLQDEMDVISYVESDSGAIGYISSTISITDYNIKVLTVNQ